MSTKYKVILVLLVLGGTFLGGFYTGRGQKEIQIQKEIVHEKGETEIVYRDRIVTVTRIVKPDGTIQETTKTEEKSRDEKSTHDNSGEKDSSKTKSLASNYSVGAKYWILFGDPLRRSLNAVEGTLGRRVVGDVWGDVGIKADSIAVGVSIKF